MSSRRLPIIVAAVVSLVTAAPAMAARDQLHIVGSGTVYPFTTTAAEQFGEGGKFKTPIVEATGTGGGFKLFCEGLGDDKADINDASRPITDSEKAVCTKNGVTPVEIPIGYDGIVIANKKDAVAINLTKKQIFLALARLLPGKDGTLVPNSYQTWNEVDPSLPKQQIEIYGPGTVSGTRDSFAELVMQKACEAFPAFAKAYLDTKERGKACQEIREDGKFIETGEDYNILVQKLAANSEALGIFGYSFYEQNPGKIQACKIDSVAPEESAIQSGKYGISRRLYIYVKKEHVGVVPGLAEFAKEMTGDNAMGQDGYLTAKGLLPLTDAERKASSTIAASLK